MPDGSFPTNKTDLLRESILARRMSFIREIDRIKSGNDIFSDLITDLQSIDQTENTPLNAGRNYRFFKIWTWFWPAKERPKTADPAVAPSNQYAPPLRRTVRTDWRPKTRVLASKALRGTVFLTKSALCVAVIVSIPLAGFAGYHHQELEARVQAAKLGWDCSQSHFLEAQDGAGYYILPVLSDADCVDAEGVSSRHVLSAPFATPEELHAHVEKIATLEGRYSKSETLFGFDVIGMMGAIYRRLAHGGRGFSAPILTAFEVQSGQRSFGDDYVGKLISIMASMRFTARHLNDPVTRERFISDSTPFVLDGGEYAGAYGQAKLYGVVGDDMTLQMQCSAAASVRTQARPGPASNPNRAAKALKVHVGSRFVACVNAHAVDDLQRKLALETGRKLCGESDLCQQPDPENAAEKRFHDNFLLQRVQDLAPSWGGKKTELEGLASIVRDSTLLSNLEAGQYLRGTFLADVQSAIREASVKIRDKVEARTGIKPQVTSIVVDVTMPKARVLGASSGEATGALLPAPRYDAETKRWVESETLGISGGSLNKVATVLVAFDQGRTTLCDQAGAASDTCKSIETNFGESINPPFELFNEQNEKEVRKLRDAIGYRAASLSGQETFGANRDFIHGAVERLPVSQMIGFYVALHHGRFDGLVLIDGTTQGMPFDLNALGYSARARAQTLKAGEATFRGAGTLSGDLDRMTAIGCTASAKTGTYNSGDNLFEKASIILHRCGDRAFVTFALIKAPQGQSFQTRTVTSDDTHKIHKAGLTAALNSASSLQ